MRKHHHNLSSCYFNIMKGGESLTKDVSLSFLRPHSVLYSPALASGDDRLCPSHFLLHPSRRKTVIKKFPHLLVLLRTSACSKRVISSFGSVHLSSAQLNSEEERCKQEPYSTLLCSLEKSLHLKGDEVNIGSCVRVFLLLLHCPLECA